MRCEESHPRSHTRSHQTRLGRSGATATISIPVACNRYNIKVDTRRMCPSCRAFITTSDKTCPIGFETPRLRRSQLYTITVSNARWSSADKTEYTWSFTQREANSSNYQIELPYRGD